MNPRSTAWRAYVQIADTLRQRITRGDLAPGSLLPSEAALCEDFSVVRNTARRALAQLETEGLIETLPGRGRAVCEPGTGATRTAAQYRRIADELRTQIGRGDLAPGDPLPSEAALVVRYRVSRGTARQALADLQGEGLIEVRHGKGRFARRRP